METPASRSSPIATPATSETGGLRDEFKVVEQVLTKNFLPSFFGN
jgi:hypothetical protein